MRYQTNRVYDPAPAPVVEPGNATPATPPNPAPSSTPAAAPVAATPTPAAAAQTPQEKAWLKLIPEAHRSDKRWEKYPGNTFEEVIPQFAERIVAAEAAISAEKIIKPKAGASPEEMEAFYKALGRPDKPDSYKFDLPPDAAKYPVRPETIKESQELFHKAGLNPDQAKIIAEGYMAKRVAEVKAAAEASEAAFAKTKETIDKMWGDQKAQQSNLVALALRSYGADLPPELAPLLDGIANDTTFQESKYYPVLVHLLARAGRDNLEDVALRSGQPRPTLGRTPDQAKRELAEKKATPEWSRAYLNPSDPRHAIVRDEARALELVIARGEKPVPA